MQTANRFAIAVHILSLLEFDQSEHTSGMLASSIGVNPVVVRNILGMLRRAGLVRTQQGVAGAELGRPLSEISLLDVYRAVEEIDPLFSIHQRPNPNCPVGANIQHTLEHVFGAAQQAMEVQLAQTTMQQVVNDLQQRARQAS